MEAECWGEGRVLCSSEDSGGATAISCPWASGGDADTMIQRMAEFSLKKKPKTEINEDKATCRSSWMSSSSS